jgi:itaconate CoA-transferase
MAELETDVALTLLDRAGVATGRLNSVAELVEHPVLTGRNRWRTVASPNGDVQALLPPVNLGGVIPAMNPIPGVGEHTDAILGERGFSAAKIASLRSRGII